GVKAVDKESGKEYTFKGKAVINATGVFVDEIMEMDQPDHKKTIRPSQGVHLVLDKEFMPGKDAIMIPKTDDGRVLFAVPWHDKVVVGTTDTPLDEHSLEPTALEEEIEFILTTAKKYLSKAPTRKDVKSVFAGLRPLAAPKGDSDKTKEISRSHKIIVSESGLITITGGKWTTFRKMGEDTVDKAVKVRQLKGNESRTEEMQIHGYVENVDFRDPLYFYGSDKAGIESLFEENPDWSKPIHENYPYLKAQVIWAVRHEMARTVEDFLARRVRVLFLDARAAIEMAETVANLMQQELEKDNSWAKEQAESFIELANRYLLEEYKPAHTI
ncbi:MAG: glycerol-3-phosphate dehydrogenase/oxidase, partial [Balneolaceae bacterium]